MLAIHCIVELEDDRYASLQLCQHPFSFTKVFTSDAPSVLPLHEFVWGLTVKAGHGLRFGIRVRLSSMLSLLCSSNAPAALASQACTVVQVLVVLLTWLLIAPTITCWLWRISFMRSFSQVDACMLCGAMRLLS